MKALILVLVFLASNAMAEIVTCTPADNTSFVVSLALNVKRSPDDDMSSAQSAILFTKAGEKVNFLNVGGDYYFAYFYKTNIIGVTSAGASFHLDVATNGRGNPMNVLTVKTLKNEVSRFRVYCQ